MTQIAEIPSQEIKKTDKQKKDDSVPFSEKTAMGGAGLAQMMTDHAIPQLANQVFNMLMGLNPAIISSVLGAVRIWDAITDPVMGSISDNTRSKFGRRRPYMLIGAILCGLAFPAIWFVPASWSDTVMALPFIDVSVSALAIWFTVATFVFYTFATVYGVSFQALLTEMTPDYQERTKVTSFVYFFQSLGWILFPAIFWLAQREIFPDAMTGMRTIGVIIGFLIAALGITGAFRSKERYHTIAAKQEKIPLLKGIKTSFSNRPFLILIGITIFMQLGNQMVNTLGSYLNYYYVYDGDLKAGSKIQLIAAFVNVPLSMIIVAIVGQKFAHIDKKKILLCGMALALIGTISKWFFITPTNPYLQLIPPLIMTPGNACFWMLIASLRADVCDHDELSTGTRSEGMFSSIHTWIMKASFSVVFAMSGFILIWTGFNQELGGRQSESTIFLWRVFYTVIPTVSIAIGIALVLAYPLSKSRMSSIRTELEANRSS